MNDGDDDKKKISKMPCRTISSYQSVKNKSLNNLFNFMSHESKNIYNTSIFFIQIFLTYKQQIFQDLYFLVKNNKIKSIDEFDKNLYKIFDQYYQKYIEIKPFKIYNNNVIYKFIVNNIKDIELVNDNYYIFEKFVIESIEKQNILKFPKNMVDNKMELFYDIVSSILKSIYNKNFNKTKEEILSKTKCTIKNNIFIDQVKNNQYLFKDINQENNKNILKEFDLFKDCPKKKGSKSDQNYISRIIYKYYTNPKIPSDLMCNIIIKAYNAYKSFFKLRSKGIKANIPKFLPKDGHYILPFFKRSFKQVLYINKREIVNRKYKKGKKKIKKRLPTHFRLTVGKNVSENYVDIIDNDKYQCLNSNEQTEYKKYVDKKYLYVIKSGEKISKTQNYIVGNYYISKKSPHIINTYYIYIKKPRKINNIKMIEIIPLYDGYNYKINFIYDLIKTDNEPIDDKEISCDLGMKNLMTFYDPEGEQYIISGNILTAMNHYYNERIDKLKSELSKAGVNNNLIHQNKALLDYIDGENPKYIKTRKTKRNPDYIKINNQINCIENKNFKTSSNKKRLISKNIRDLLIKREQKISQYFDKIVSWIISKFGDCSRIIIGYNKEWKKNVNMGKNVNRNFYEIPYGKLLKKLKDQLEKNNQELVIIEESYTSKCDALSLEPIKKHEIYKGKRIKRGLFSSHIGVLINADLNGAINILRKWRERIGKPIKKITGKNIYNPIKLYFPVKL